MQLTRVSPNARSLVLARLMALAAVGLLGACPQAKNDGNGTCTEDEDCGAYKRCEASIGICLCTADAGCSANEFCNPAGSCQPLTNCQNNEDCRTPEAPLAICNTDNGECVSLDGVTTQCAKDSHCPFGFFCENAQCVQGCRDNGDCPLGDPCIEGQCNFNPGACNENGYCDYGESCTANLTCFTHPDADVLCDSCDPFNLLDPGCSDCLIDPAVPATICDADNDCAEGSCVHFPCGSDTDCPPGETCEGGGLLGGECSGHCGAFFCGNASCDDTSAPCPRGYNCYQVVSVSNNLCTKNGGECASGSTCSADLEGENQENGSCSCLSDDDCPLGVTCMNPGLGGACISGSTCAPSPGLTCEDVR